MARFAKMDINDAQPEMACPEPGSVIHGTPTFRSWSLDEEDDCVSAGLWEATPGKWRFENTNWEYCRILSGVSVVTEDGGEAHTVKAGDSFILRVGFKGTWEVLETTLKDYVIKI
ncbi:MAG: cupin domain-containing protein [Micavibrio sp.]